MQLGSTITARILSFGLCTAAAGAFFSIVLAALPNRGLEFYLDPGGEGTAFAWASTVATFSAAYAAVLLAFAVPARRLRFAALAVCFALLSLDDMTQLHERLGARVFHEALDLSANVSEQLEVLLFAPLLAYAVWAVLSLVHGSERRVSRVLIGGVSLLGLAIASELGGLVTRRLDERGVPHVNGVRLGIEEAAELAGWILVATALTAMACTALGSPSPDQASPD